MTRASDRRRRDRQGGSGTRETVGGRGGTRRREPGDLRFQACVVAIAVVVGVVGGLAGSPRVSTATAGGKGAGDAPTDGRGGDPGDDGDRGGEPATDSASPALTALFGHLDPDGGLDLLLSFSFAEGHETGAVILIPTTTLAEVPSLSTQILADVVRLGSLRGPDLLHTTVENALGTGCADLLLVDDAKLISLLAPAQTLAVDFRRALRVDDAAGTLAFTAGRQEIDVATAMRLLVAPGGRGEMEHLVTVQAIIEGWLAALRDSGVAAASVAVDPAARSLVVASGADVRYDTLPVTSIATGGDERFTLRRAEARGLLERAMPWALLGGEPRPRIEILNGTGAVGVTQSVAAAIVPDGVEVTLTGNLPGFGAAETQVVYYRDEHRATAEMLAGSLGVGHVARAARPVDVIDVTIIVGADMPALPLHSGRG